MKDPCPHCADYAADVYECVNRAQARNFRRGLMCMAECPMCHLEWFSRGAAPADTLQGPQVGVVRANGTDLRWDPLQGFITERVRIRNISCRYDVKI